MDYLTSVQTWFWLILLQLNDLVHILCFWPIILISFWSERVRDLYFAVYYKAALFFMKDALQDCRKCLFQQLTEIVNTEPSGNVSQILEIGAGTGANFPYYPSGSTINTMEMNTEFHRHQFLEAKKNGLKFGHFGQCLGYAEKMDVIPDNSIDIVVGTLVLCCVKDKQKGLHEIHRVLKPGGMYFLAEFDHYDKGFFKAIQKFHDVFHRIAALGCTAAHQDVRSIINSGNFKTVKLVNKEYPKLIVPFRKVCYGFAQK